ncbi:peptide ABC transporter ATP-binding protein [Aliidiomarina sedimenti]|uniref:Peptide ABC transporter ATP-binding protein n=1 Tax=Aliidiomarina sedimenti TaxID=1933879 RepID=A0ABY0C2C4_9GAMM|nr:ATP-binding cassette domain-containing protein [Aliidiomarina sedimenti]RUO31946.1 peptide ABC transporter ATP-binding protein [Aliidiomarina sedimenti]
MTSLLRVENLNKAYLHKGRWWAPKRIRALNNVSFDLESGQTLAIMGETGSGKSSLAKIIAGAERPSSGTVYLRGKPLKAQDYRFRCRHIRMVFQDTDASLNPHLTIGRQLEEPLLFNTHLSSEQRRETVSEALLKVGLLPEHAVFHSHMMSTGQKQRACIARAIMLNPDVIVADEALAALDSSIRAQIINLLLDLQRDMKMSYVFVSHSPEIIRHIADKVMIMRHGEIVTYEDTASVFNKPVDGYTESLLQQTYTLS